jgi:hypothetical protein
MRPDGVHLSYARMESLLASYGHFDALEVTGNLDTKVEELLRQSGGRAQTGRSKESRGRCGLCSQAQNREAGTSGD